MTENDSHQKQNQEEKVRIAGLFWPVFILNGLYSVSWGGIIFLIVPISRIFWPNEPAHALEMGVIITTLSWGASASGLFFGRMIDNLKRVTIIAAIALTRGFSFLMLGFTIYAGGTSSWLYFLFFVAIVGLAAGGHYPSVISMSNDLVPKAQRSRFFGIYEITRNILMVVGFLVGALLFQVGYWRQFFISVGGIIIIFGILSKIYLKEPKRGIMHEELTHILSIDGVEYDFKIDLKMMKKTMLSKTNRVALIEGIFTCILLGSLNFLILNYIQNPPHNISEFSTAIFMVVWGLPGGLIGTMLLARLSDKVATKKPLMRLPIIILSIIGGILSFALFFWLPYPELTVEQGQDIAYMMSLPVIWMMGFLFFGSRAIFSLYIVNQAPLLQSINLPEAQAQITSWNQFLENFGRGLGPLISGILLTLTFYDYRTTVFFVSLCILPGVILWLMALKWYHGDVDDINRILRERAIELTNQTEKTEQETAN